MIDDDPAAKGQDERQDERPGARRADRGRHGPWAHDRRWAGGEWRGKPPFMRRIGCFFGLLFLLTLIGAASVVGIVASWLGILDGRSGVGPGPIAQGAIILLALAFLVGLWRLGRGLRGLAIPIGDLFDAARNIEQGDLSARVPVRGRMPGDLRRLIAAFNTMAERLEVDERQRRTLLADVSHELRTPLAVIRGNLEAIADGVHPADPDHLQAIIDETGVLARLVDDLRTVALAEAGTLPLHPEPTDLVAVARDVVAAHRPSAAANGVDLQLDATEVATLDVDPVRMREIVGNLVTNALRYTPSGGVVRVIVGPETGGVRLAVADTGAGIDSDALPHIFDRFWKSPDSRGSGLGLAIVRSLVAGHGGSVDVTSEPEAGTTIGVHIPGSTSATG